VHFSGLYWGFVSATDLHFAAIDVGSNAARLKVARLGAGHLEIVHAERDGMRPGDGVFTDGVMPDAVVARLCSTLIRFAEASRFFDAEVRAVATSALRSAANRDEVVARVARASGITLEVISGEDEARLTCLGVRAGADADERALCIDVGGGSTEVVLARGERPERLWTVEHGAARLAERLGDDLPALRVAAAEALAEVGPLDTPALPMAVGCSGSVRALVGFATERARGWATVHEVGGAAEELARMRPKRRQRFFSPARARLIVPAAALLEAAMCRLQVYAVHATKRGLRDGILVELSRGSAIGGVTQISSRATPRDRVLLSR
jgi:exopolyphosphatase/guanosine-5'-triphosphate,3'-diphosphate pyrophosphatase